MGGGKEKKKTNAMIDTQQTQLGAEHDQDRQANSAAEDEARVRAGESYGRVNTSLDRIQGTNYDVTPDFAEARGLYRKFADSGGVDENRMRVSHPLYQEQINSPEIANRYRGGGVYDEFAKTGGVSAADAANIRSRSNSVIPSMFGQIRDEGNRMAQVQGGYNPGAQYLQASMGRDQASAAAANVRDTELGLKDQINAGRQWGASGMTTSEGALQGMRQGAANSLDSSEANIQNTLQQGRMFGTQGIYGVSDAEAGYQVGNANRRLQRDSTVLGGSQDLYGTSQGAALGYGGQRQAERQGYYDAQGNFISIRAGVNKGQGIPWGAIASGAATAAPYIAMAASSRTFKEDIKPLGSDDEVGKKLDKLKLYKWRYKGDETEHMGPIAEEFKDTFGVGDGKTLHLADVMGVVLASAKANRKGYRYAI